MRQQNVALSMIKPRIILYQAANIVKKSAALAWFLLAFRAKPPELPPAQSYVPPAQSELPVGVPTVPPAQSHVPPASSYVPPALSYVTFGVPVAPIQKFPATCQDEFAPVFSSAKRFCFPTTSGSTPSEIIASRVGLIKAG